MRRAHDIVTSEDLYSNVSQRVLNTLIIMTHSNILVSLVQYVCHIFYLHDEVIDCIHTMIQEYAVFLLLLMALAIDINEGLDGNG